MKKLAIEDMTREELVARYRALTARLLGNDGTPNIAKDYKQTASALALLDECQKLAAIEQERYRQQHP